MVMFRTDELAPTLTCHICNKIQRNSTTVTECLHSFCTKCIVKKIINEGLNQCPICHTYLGCNPVQKLRPNHDSRSLVAKIFSPLKKNTDKPDVSEGEPKETESAKGEEEEPEMSSIPVPAKGKKRFLSSLMNTPELTCETVQTKRKKARSQGIVLRTPPSTISKEKPSSSKGKWKEGKSTSNYITTDDDEEEEEEEEEEEKDKPARSAPVSVDPKKKPRGRPKKVVTPSEGFRISPQAVVDANAGEGRLNSIWLSLIATYRQDAGPPLPQISANYLRIKNIHAKVLLLKRYLVRKLNLQSEVEVEIELRGLGLPDNMELGHLIASSEKISTAVGSSAEDFVMVLSYSRKAWLS